LAPGPSEIFAYDLSEVQLKTQAGDSRQRFPQLLDEIAPMSQNDKPWPPIRGGPIRGHFRRKGVVMYSVTQAITVPECALNRLELARELFDKFYGRCFWHSPRNLEITEDLIPFVMKGLCDNGGRSGFMWAEKLNSAAFD
jgi:hypothetical protein